VLDNSVVMRWLLNHGSKERLAYASKVLDLLTQDIREALVPSVRGRGTLPSCQE
jgi:hypothetical protein